MDITPGARRFVAVAGIALGLFWAVALVSASPHDWPFDAARQVRHVSNYSGPLGSLLAWAAVELLGRVFAWLVPLWLVAAGAATMTRWIGATAKWVFRTAVLAVLLGALFALTSHTAGVQSLRGSAGDAVAATLSLVLGRIGGTIVLLAVFLLVIPGAVWRRDSKQRKTTEKKGQEKPPRSPRIGELIKLPVRVAGATGRFAAKLARGIAGLAGVAMRAFRSEQDGWEDAQPDFPVVAGDPAGGAATTEDLFDTGPWKRPGTDDERSIHITATPEKKKQPPPDRVRAKAPDKADGGPKKPLSTAALPPLSMLEHGIETRGSYSHGDLEEWSRVLENKLLDYGVEGRVTSVHHGPIVTTFEFEPAAGVRIKDIVNRADDLALAMRARSLRMIAPIPGRAAVGIEIPNPEGRTVYLHDILNEISEKQRVGGVMLGLGVDVVGKPFLMNLCEAPHLLVAGTTGSGKSVCLNAILASILFQYRPDDVQILLVDPKMIEMSMYNGIPHLLHPVIHEPKEAAKVLEYLTSEMTRRNKLFRRHGVKNIESYNTKVALGKIDGVDEKPEKLPYIVLIVDELGDLALAKGVDIETLLARLAQMARAAGIHMVLATQRPSVDVIVGKTKANFPTRIAFRVATKVDSRTIIDTIGADKLLGKGDMLFADAQNPVPLRLHGAWVSENNIEDLIAHWKSYDYEQSTLTLESQTAGSASLDGDFDPLYGDARGIVIQYKQGSTSLLQRKLHVGYARAARLLDQLEESGVVGPSEGTSKPREVYVDAVEEAME